MPVMILPSETFCLTERALSPSPCDFYKAKILFLAIERNPDSVTQCIAGDVEKLRKSYHKML